MANSNSRSPLGAPKGHRGKSPANHTASTARGTSSSAKLPGTLGLGASAAYSSRSKTDLDPIALWRNAKKDPFHYVMPSDWDVYYALNRRIDRAVFKEQLQVVDQDLEDYLTFIGGLGRIVQEDGKDGESAAIDALRTGVSDNLKHVFKTKWLEILFKASLSFGAELAEDGLKPAQIKFVEKASLETIFAILEGTFGDFYKHAAKAYIEKKPKDMVEAFGDLIKAIDVGLSNYDGIATKTIRVLYARKVITTAREAAAVRKLLLKACSNLASVSGSLADFLASAPYIAMRIVIADGTIMHGECTRMLVGLRERLRKRRLVWDALHPSGVEDHATLVWPQFAPGEQSN